MIESLRTRLEHSSFAPLLKSRTKREVMAELADLLVADGAVAPENRDAILTALLEREGKMSTGMQLGVAIPHAKTSAVAGLVTAVALAPEGIDFDSLDAHLAKARAALRTLPDSRLSNRAGNAEKCLLVEADFAAGTLTVRYDSMKVGTKNLVDALARAGLEAEEIRGDAR